MPIGSINIAMGASYGAYNQRLTQETKQKLMQLNIPFDPNITEQEGKALLKKAQASKNFQNDAKQNSSSKNSLFDQAIALAKKLGIQPNESTKFEQLLSLIENAIEQKLALNKNNVEIIEQLKGLSQELASIQAQSNSSSGYDSNNQALMTSLELLSQYNKNFLYK